MLPNDGSGDTEYLAVTGCDLTGYIYMGGYTMSSSLLWGRAAPLPVLTQIDTAANTYAYRRSFEVDSGDLHAISAMTMSPNCKHIALHMTSLRQGAPAFAQGNVSYLGVVYANDAHYVTPFMRIVHNTGAQGAHTVLPSGILYDNHERVYAAFLNVAAVGRNSDNGAITNYASKSLIGGFDVLAEKMLFYKE